VLVHALLLSVVPASAAGTAPITSATAKGSPFHPDGDGVRETVTLSLQLSAAAELSVTAVDFDGRAVRTLLAPARRAAGTYSVRWDGRSSAGARVPDGPYRLRARAVTGAGEVVVERLVTKSPSVAYAPRPRSIVVAIDPGHGGSRTGAVAADGSRESDFNLDIARRLRAMLEGARIGTVLTRSTDRDVNEPAVDRNDDAVIEYVDELASRPDVANAARADLFLSVHNNTAVDPRVGGPSTFRHRERSFSAESLRFGRLVQAQMVDRLGRYRTSSWRPYDHGVLHHDYYVLSPYAPPRRPRPSLMPGVLSEGLFLSHPYELELLKRRDVRTSMAVAYYEAISRYLAARPAAARYDSVVAPSTAVEGEHARYEVRVTNRGSAATQGWTLEAGAVPAVTRYDGSGVPGERLGAVAVPTLAPGANSVITLDLPAPPGGEWLVRFDVVLPDGRRLSALGSPALQVPLSVPLPPGTEPSPAPSSEPTPEASAEPSPLS
jgi:N-acetylmuramoyl-L-alanine amidase